MEGKSIPAIDLYNNSLCQTPKATTSVTSVVTEIRHDLCSGRLIASLFCFNNSNSILDCDIDITIDTLESLHMAERCRSITGALTIKINGGCKILLAYLRMGRIT